MKYSREKEVCSITVTYNPNLTILKRQIIELTYQVEHIIIVDNGSKNIDDIISEFSCIEKVSIIRLDENMGIAYAQNKGIKFAKSLTVTHVITFDHDSEIPKGFISELLASEQELLALGERVAAVGPSFFNSNTNKNYPVPYLKNIPLLKGLIVGRKHFTNSQYLESYFLIASGCLMRISVLNDIGLMDSELFIDNVDLEWCLRAQIRGYKVFTTNRTSMSHLIGDSTRKFLGRNISVHSNIRKYYNTRNNLLLIRYDGIPLGLKVRMIPALFIRFLIGILDTENKNEYFKFYYWAIIDFLSNKKGKFKH
ncbi:rhamnosyltransferase [Aliivibrio fischeri]|uniref:rhamnosyltransferase n=1 Tax=Aliivibrio fischeri TaxID=668 RepID=UPI0018C5DAD7